MRRRESKARTILQCHHSRPFSFPTCTLAARLTLRGGDVGRDEATQAVEYAFFVRGNKFVELDFRPEGESRGDFRGFARAQEIFDFLVSRGDISLRTPVGSR
jgi:hypothetical protein